MLFYHSWFGRGFAHAQSFRAAERNGRQGKKWTNDTTNRPRRRTAQAGSRGFRSALRRFWFTASQIFAAVTVCSYPLSA
jgi:hypothetical protein